jgi:hypothetical protein
MLSGCAVLQLLVIVGGEMNHPLASQLDARHVKPCITQAITHNQAVWDSFALFITVATLLQ